MNSDLQALLFGHFEIKLKERIGDHPLFDEFSRCALRVIDEFLQPEPPNTNDPLTVARYKDARNRFLRTADAAIADRWIDLVAESFELFAMELPSVQPGPFVFDIPVTLKAAELLLSNYYLDKNPDFFPDLKKTLAHNFAIKNPTPQQLLARTPFARLLNIRAPFGIPLKDQFAHTWVCAGSGHGKTTALIAMLYEHLPYVVKGDRSIVLIDSQNVIIPQLEKLKIWEGTDRLIVIDPEDPIAFSLFDIPPHMLNAGIDLINFIFSKLTNTSSETTYRQDNLFNYLSEFLITAVPNATIHDFRNMLDREKAKDYDKYKTQASDEVQNYLETDFVKEKFTVDARQQVLTKMRGMLRQPAFATMFSAPKTKLNLFNELERGTCILIKPSKYLMGDDGTRLFGRFWIAQMNMVAQQRQATQKKTPTFFYIDECQDYLRGGDPKLEGMFEQARKENIGVTLLHHYGEQLKSNDLVQLLGACTTTKMCGSLGSSDLSRFSSYMQCDPQFILQQRPTKSFAAHVRGVTPRAISLAFPFIELESEPKMSDDAYQAMRAENRRRYGATHTASTRTEPTLAPAQNAQSPPKEALRETKIVPPGGDAPSIQQHPVEHSDAKSTSGLDEDRYS